MSQVFLWPSPCHVTRGSLRPSIEEPLAACFCWNQSQYDHGSRPKSLVEEGLPSCNNLPSSGVFEQLAGNGAACSSYGIGVAASVLRSGSAGYWTACCKSSEALPALEPARLTTMLATPTLGLQ